MTLRTIAEVFPLKDFLKEEMDTRGWSQADLAEVIGCLPRDVHDLVSGKVTLKPKMATALADAFGTSPEYWMNLETAHQAWQANRDEREARSRRGRLFDVAPIREMQKRGWLPKTENVQELETRVLAFYCKNQLSDIVPEDVAARMSVMDGEHVRASVYAWAQRAKNVAPAVTVKKHFSDAALGDCLARLKLLLAEPIEVRHVSRVLADSGIRFVVVEHLPKTRIDGACLWLDAKSPVVAMSMRYERLDWFWFTLIHELAHVKHRDGAKIDADLVGTNAQKVSDKSDVEKAADDFAENYLIPKTQMDDFVARTRPLYSRAAIKGFAKRMKVHPSIVVGQLQHREEIPYYHSRELMKDKVRDIVTANAITDGLGQALSV